MEKVQQTADTVVNTWKVDIISVPVCIARANIEDETLSCFIDLLAKVFHYTKEQISSLESQFKGKKRMVVGRFARDVANSFVFSASCYLSDIQDDNYVVYIQEGTRE